VDFRSKYSGPRGAVRLAARTFTTPIHVGHAFSYIIFDAAKRYLKFAAYRQGTSRIHRHRRRIIAKALKKRRPIQALAQVYIDRFYERDGRAQHPAAPTNTRARLA